MPLPLSNPFGIPGQDEFLRRFGTTGIFGPVEGQGVPGTSLPTPPTGSWADKLAQKLGGSPGAQLGLRILANNRGGQSLGNVLGKSFLQQQEAGAQSQQAGLQQQLIQAQIDHLKQPEQDNSAPVIVMGPDGKPRYVSRREAVGQQPYQQAPGASSDPREVAIARMLNNPDVPEAVKKDLRSLVAPHETTPSFSQIPLADGTYGVLNNRTGEISRTGAQLPAKTPPPLQENDKKVAVLFNSLKGSEKDIQNLKTGDDTGSIYNSVMGGSPLTRPLQTSDFKKYEAAGLRWAANLLYIKSGATANADEIRSTWKQFFPQPGEDATTKSQKEAARKQEMQAIEKVYKLGDAPTPNAPSPDNDPLGIRK